MRDVLDRNPDRTARGLACYWLASRLNRLASIPDALGNPRVAQQIRAKFAAEDVEAIRVRLPELRREVRALYERAAREFADLPMHFNPGGQEEELIGPRARRWLDQHPEPTPAPAR